jgi:hypothetical protein
MFLVETESGAKYLFSEGLATARRVSGDWPMRKDGSWLTVLQSHIALGKPMQLELETAADPSFHVWRTTTPVTHMEYIDEQRANDLLAAE